MERTLWNPADGDCPHLWDGWVDALGQPYEAGAYVMYAMISGRSPQLVFARVIEIWRTDGKGKEITERTWEYTGETITDGSGRTRRETRTVYSPSCKVKVQPLKDARGFYRSDGPDGVRPVLLTIPENIVKIEPPVEWTDEFLAEDLAKLRDELA